MAGPPNNISKEPFPVLRSLLSVEALGRWVEKTFMLPGARCRLIKAKVCDTYRVWSSRGSFVLRIYPQGRRTFKEIQAEVELLNFLAEKELNVVPVIPNASGEYIQQIQAPEGIRYAVLSPFIEGKELSKTPTADQVRQLGRATGLLHQVTNELPENPARLNLGYHELIEEPLQAFAKVAETEARKEIMVYLKEVPGFLKPFLQNLPVTKPHYGLVHGDLIPSNVLLGKAGLILLDFDFFGFSWRVYDLASYTLEVRFWQTAPEAADIFLEAYQEISLLDAEDLHLLPVFEAVRAFTSLGIPAAHVNEWGSSYITDNSINPLVRSIKKSMVKLKGPRLI